MLFRNPLLLVESSPLALTTQAKNYLTQEAKLLGLSQPLPETFSVAGQSAEQSFNLLKTNSNPTLAWERAAENYKQLVKSDLPAQDKQALAKAMLENLATNGQMPFWEAPDSAQQNRGLQGRCRIYSSQLTSQGEGMYTMRITPQTVGLYSSANSGPLSFKAEASPEELWQLKDPSTYSGEEIKAQQLAEKNLAAYMQSPAYKHQVKTLKAQIVEAINQGNTQKLETLCQPISEGIAKAYGIKPFKMTFNPKTSGNLGEFDATTRKMVTYLGTLKEYKAAYQEQGLSADAIASQLTAATVSNASHEALHALQKSVLENPVAFGEKPETKAVKDLEQGFEGYISPTLSKALNGTQGLYKDQPLELHAEAIEAVASEKTLQALSA